MKRKGGLAVGSGLACSEAEASATEKSNSGLALPLGRV